MVFITPTILQSSADQEMILRRELGRRRQALKDQLEELMNRGDAEMPKGE
jgi:hypothetical protein